MKNSKSIIGIAGGSGSGKTTLAISFYKKYKGRCSILHLDDYFNKKDDIPKLNGFVNWEDPKAIRFDDIYQDLLCLKKGKSVVVKTKSELFNPNYSTKNPVKIDHKIDPKEIIIFEGYMALLDPRIRDLLDVKVFLEMPLEKSSKRRSKTKNQVDPEYFKKVLKPMYKKIIEPTKKFADLVVDVSDKNTDEIMCLVEKMASI